MAATLSEGKGQETQRAPRQGTCMVAAEGGVQPVQSSPLCVLQTLKDGFTSTFHTSVFPFPIPRLISAPGTSKRR